MPWAELFIVKHTEREEWRVIVEYEDREKYISAESFETEQQAVDYALRWATENIDTELASKH